MYSFLSNLWLFALVIAKAAGMTGLGFAVVMAFVAEISMRKKLGNKTRQRLESWRQAVQRCASIEAKRALERELHRNFVNGQKGQSKRRAVA